MNALGGRRILTLSLSFAVDVPEFGDVENSFS
jgi:hypothetical protein